jgi:hypothetical protein
MPADRLRRMPRNGNYPVETSLAGRMRRDHHSRDPGWDRPACAASRPERLIWTREASHDVTYSDSGVEETFAPSLIRTDQVSISEAGAAVHVGQVVIRFADDAVHRAGRGTEAGRGADRVG